MRKEWRNARRIVVKIGSSLLTEPASGKLKTGWLASLAEDIAALKTAGKNVIVVSSGAIALGRNVLKLPPGPLNLEDSQAAAAVGQIGLAHGYQNIFQALGMNVAQILLTLGDTEERRRYLNARNTIETLLRHGAVPVVNENDTVATSEIRYGDNDRLAARVASMMSCDCLVLLSDVDGLYTTPPGRTPAGKRLGVVPEITPEIEAMAGDTGTELSRGGMVTKIEAAKAAVAAGAHMVIAAGKVMHPLKRLEQGGPCTWFVAHANPAASRKRWIAGALEPKGAIIIDSGAADALQDGKSLLPAGIVRLEGKFERGDAVVIRTVDGRDIGRGLAAYGLADGQKIAGHQSREIEEILGYRGRSEFIHRDDLTLKRK